MIEQTRAKWDITLFSALYGMIVKGDIYKGEFRATYETLKIEIKGSDVRVQFAKKDSKGQMSPKTSSIFRARGINPQAFALPGRFPMMKSVVVLNVLASLFVVIPSFVRADDNSCHLIGIEVPDRAQPKKIALTFDDGPNPDTTSARFRRAEEVQY